MKIIYLFLGLILVVVSACRGSQGVTTPRKPVEQPPPPQTKSFHTTVTELKAQEGGGISASEVSVYITGNLLFLDAGSLERTLLNYQLLTASGDILFEKDSLVQSLSGGRGSFRAIIPTYEKAEFVRVRFYQTNTTSSERTPIAVDGLPSKLPNLVPKKLP